MRDTSSQAVAAFFRTAVLKKAATACDDVSRKAGLLHRLGRLYEQELDNEPLALNAYHVSLDLEPTKVEAFQDMERLLVKRQEWKLLEESYRAMLGRAQNLTPGFRLVLWRNLAELYDRGHKVRRGYATRPTENLA